MEITDPNLEPVLAFVVSKENDGSTFMLTAYNEAVSRGLKAKWMSLNSLNDDKFDLSFYYVVGSFNGPEFKRLLKDTTKIYSAHCINACSKLKRKFPTKNMPIHNISFCGIVACCTSIDKSERLEIHDLITKMGGSIKLDLTPEVTHLIAGEIGSNKYEVSRDRKIPVMLRKWVYEVWKINQKSHMHATDDFFDQYRCPIFKGCTICVTGIDANERQKIKQLVTKNGGKYSGELNMKTCTHLIATDNRSQKFKHAVLWKINCVLPEWFYDCINANAWLNESPYKINDETINDLSTVENRRSIISASFSTTRLSIDHKRSSFSTKAAEVAKKSKESISRESISQLEKSTHNLYQIDIKSIKNIDVNSIPTTSIDTCFDGLTLYISGFSSKITQLIYRLINSGGGMRFNEINESVTHVIAGDLLGKKELLFLSTTDHRPYVIGIQWLCDSCNSGQLMDESDYSLVKERDEMNDDTLMNQLHDLDDVKNVSSRNRLIDNDIDEGNESDDLLEQYMDDQNNDDDEIIINALHDNGVDINNLSDNLVFDDNEKATTKEEDNVDANGLFANLKFSISGFKQDQKEQIETTVKSQDGIIVSKNLAKYDIVPLRHDINANLSDNMVTLCWLEQCIEQNSFIDPSTDFIYQPFCLAQGNKILKDCVLSISQYSGLEKEHLMHLLTALGGLVQEIFARKEAKNTKTSTHLIVKNPEGTKYDAANKWNIPCVRKEWLYACSDQGCLVKCDNYIVTLSSSNPIPYQRKVTKVIMKKPQSRTNSTPTLIKRRPALELTKSFLPSFDVSDTMSALQSPAPSSQRKSRGSFPLGSMFEENIQIALSRTEKGNKLKSFNNEKSTSLSKDILDGCKITISHTLNGKCNLSQIAKDLGADTSHVLDKYCTHLIIEDGGIIDDDVTLARHLGKYIVSPEWLHKCQEDGYYIPEEDFSPSFKPQLTKESLSATSKIENNNGTLDKLNHSEMVSSDDPDLHTSTTEQLVNNDTTDLQRQLEALMEVTKTSRGTTVRSGRPISNSSSGGANEDRPGLRSSRRQRSISQYNCKETDNKVDAGSEPSQNDVVTYDDPAGRLERQKILAQLKSENEKPMDSLSEEPVDAHQETCKAMTPNQSRFEINDDEDIPIPSHALTPPLNPVNLIIANPSELSEPVNLLEDQKSTVKKQQKKFLMTALTPQEKTEYAALIEKFGGIFLDAMYFQPQCTHMIVGAPNKNEKFFASVAAGKWVLHKSYFEASREADQFVDEEAHEWGNERNPTRLSAAAKKWRLKLMKLKKDGGKINAGAFDGWKVLLCVDKSKQPGFKRLLEAGNAKILGAKPPFESIKGATHAFINPTKAKPGTLNIPQLLAENITILKPEYISEYLVQDPVPSIEQFIISESKIMNETSPEYIASHSKRKSNAKDGLPSTKRAKR